MARTSRDALVQAIKSLGEAQAAVADAMITLDWFERRFQEGQYKELSTEEVYKMRTGQDYPDYTIKKPKKSRANDTIHSTYTNPNNTGSITITN